ncbi:hypothetical protein DUNSADRAFT_12544, partial [Dunaliella salina]
MFSPVFVDIPRSVLLPKPCFHKCGFHSSHCASNAHQIQHQCGTPEAKQRQQRRQQQRQTQAWRFPSPRPSHCLLDQQRGPPCSRLPWFSHHPCQGPTR